MFEDATDKIACYLQYGDRNINLIEKSIIVFEWEFGISEDEQRYLELHEFALENAVTFTNDVNDKTSYSINRSCDFLFGTPIELCKYRRNILSSFNDHLLVDTYNASLLADVLTTHCKKSKKKTTCNINLIGKLTWLSNILLDSNISKVNQVFFMTFCDHKRENIYDNKKRILAKCSLSEYLWLQNLMRVGEVYLMENLVFNNTSIPNNLASQSEALYNFSNETNVVLVSSDSVRKGVLDNLLYFGFDSRDENSEKQIKMLERKFDRLSLNEKATNKGSESNNENTPIPSQTSTLKPARKDFFIEKYLKQRDKTLALIKQRVNGFAAMLDSHKKNDFVITPVENLHAVAEGATMAEQTLVLLVEIKHVFSLKISFNTQDATVAHNKKLPLNFAAKMMLDVHDTSGKLAVMLRDEKVKQCFKNNFWLEIETMAREYMTLTGEACIFGISIGDIMKKDETLNERSFLQAGELFTKINKKVGEYIKVNILTKSLLLQASSSDITYYNKASDEDDDDSLNSDTDSKMGSSKEGITVSNSYNNVSNNTHDSPDDSDVDSEIIGSNDGNWAEKKIMVETKRNLLLVLKVISFTFLNDQQKCNFLLKSMSDNLQAFKNTDIFVT